MRLADALRVMDSQPVIREGIMDIMSNFEALGAAQNVTTCMNKKVLVAFGDLN